MIALLDGSPAEKDGIKAGDIIVKVDGVSTVGWDLSKAVTQIQGPQGTPVTLTVVHSNGNKQVDIKIVRDVITVKSVVMNIESAKCTSSGCTDISKATCWVMVVRNLLIFSCRSLAITLTMSGQA